MKRILSDIDMKGMIYSPHHAHTVSKILTYLTYGLLTRGA